MKQARWFYVLVTSGQLEQEELMLKHSFRLVLVAGLMAVGLWAANDPFVGEWKLNPSKSKLTDEMKVESVGENKYAFDFGDGNPETIVVDGTDQPGAGGTTLSVTSEGPHSWKVVRKKDGRILITGIWELSKDGNTLRDDFTFTGADGKSSNVKYVYQRTAGTSGFAGTWDGTSETADLVFVLKVQPYDGDGLSFISPSDGGAKNVKFDGKEYANEGPNVSPGSVSSARRVNERRLERTDKVAGKIVDTRQIELSSDLKTLTMTVHNAGRRQPDILVFERQ